jgi:hypothetical protein
MARWIASVACDSLQEKWIAEFGPIVTAPVLMAIGASSGTYASNASTGFLESHTLGVMGFLGAAFIEHWLTVNQQAYSNRNSGVPEVSRR